MKLEEHKTKGNIIGTLAKEAEDDNHSTVSHAKEEGLPGQYEEQLMKYEAEVRNHIKIEQQLKLHIECIQDKSDDFEK
jgi:hypothetical protein